MEKKQINPRHPGSESLSAHRGRTKKKENNPALYSTITGHIFSFLLLLLFFWCFCLHRAGTLLHPQPLHHLHLNNKLKPVKFRHCDYQSNCIIDLPHLKKNRTNCGQSCDKCDIRNQALTTCGTVCQREQPQPGFKDLCGNIGLQQKLGPLGPL